METVRIKTFITVLIAAFISLAVSITAFAEENVDTTKFVTGTKINGIGVGGLTVEEATATIEGFYAGEYTLAVKRRGGKEDRIKGTDIDYRVAVPDGLAAILEAQNAAGRNSGPSVDNSHSLQMTAVYSEEKLAAAISSLPCISGSGITVTEDAHISAYEEGKPFSIVPAVQGNNVDVAKTTALITEAVKNGQTSVDLDGAGCYYQVNIWESSQELQALCDTMNSYGNMNIQYLFGEEKETLSGSTISTWITGSQDNVVTLDMEKITAFVAEMAARRDTAGTNRAFHTATGRDVVLTGPYGWKIDAAGEIAALTQLLQAGPVQGDVEREPVYAARAAARTPGDWGTTYVEIDLTGQHVYMIKDGALVWDAPCVTGNVSKNYTTPPGIYSLTYKEKDRILRGAKQADGSYEYESHVDYWMPFNGGIGLHDADWRSKFGGEIYKNGGSHGCVNLPPAKAALLYDLVYKGIPVICYN